jgi:hypothetical protein
MKRFTLLTCFTCVLLGLQAQKIDDFLDKYTGNNKVGYLQPLNEILLPALNIGWGISPRIDSSFYLNIGIVGSNAFVLSPLRTFSATTEAPFEPQTTATAPTIVGDIDPVYVEGVNGTSYIFPGGASLEYAPLAVPQLTIGGFFGTELSGRFFTWNIGGDIGKFNMYGVGFRHDISRYFPHRKIYWNVGYNYQSVKIGDKMALTDHFIVTDVGKYAGKFYWFGRLGYQTGNLKIHYQVHPDDGGEFVDVSLKKVFPLMAGVGCGVDVWIFRFHLAVNYSKVPFGEAGLFFCF